MNRRKTSKHSSSKRKRTRKNTSNSTTIEMLHASFIKIDDVVRDMIKKDSSDSAIACRIRHEWKTMFQQKISDSAIQGLLLHYRSMYGAKKAQRGGMAPLEYTLAQGTTAPYGNFPVDITTNKQFIHDLDATRTYDSSIGKGCSQGGGGFGFGGFGFGSAVNMGHIPNSVPRLQEILSPYTPVSSSAHLQSFTANAYNPSDIVSIPNASTIYRPI